MIAALKTGLQHLQEHIQSRLSQYHSHHNDILPPISRLLLELFSRVLVESVTLKAWFISRLQALAQVARAWKHVVLGTPELWAVIKMHRRHPHWQEDLDLVLARSRRAPLTIQYDDDSDADRDSDTDDDDETNHMDAGTKSDMLEHVASICGDGEQFCGMVLCHWLRSPC